MSARDPDFTDSPALALTLDGQGRILSALAADPALASARYGASPEDWVGRSLGMLFSPQASDADALLRCVADTRASGRASRRRIALDLPKGSYDFLASVSAFDIPEGRLITALFVDLGKSSKRERAASAPPPAGLREAVDTQLAHELNNLALAAEGLLGVVSDDASPSSRLHRYASEIAAHADAAAALQRSVSRRRRRQSERFDLCEEVRAFWPVIAAALEPSGSLDVELPTTPLWVRADPEEIAQVVLELVLDARESTKSTGGNVQIRSGLLAGERGEGTVWLDVRGESPESAASVRRRILRPGLIRVGRGFRIVPAEIETRLHRYAGALEVLQSRSGGGTARRVSLPEASGPVAADGEAASGSHVRRERGTAIICESEVALQTLVVAVATLEGCDPVTVADAAQLARALRSQSEAEIAFVYFGLSDDDSFDEALAALDPLGRTIRARLIFSSAGKSSESPPGVVALQRPFTLGELRGAVEKALGAAAPV